MSGRFGNLVLLALAACILCSLPSAVDVGLLLAPMSRNEVYFTSIGSAWTSNAPQATAWGVACVWVFQVSHCLKSINEKL